MHGMLYRYYANCNTTHGTSNGKQISDRAWCLLQHCNESAESKHHTELSNGRTTGCATCRIGDHRAVFTQPWAVIRRRGCLRLDLQGVARTLAGACRVLDLERKWRDGEVRLRVDMRAFVHSELICSINKLASFASTMMRWLTL